jgi:hypothetical protein
MSYVSYTPNMVAAMGASDPSGIGADVAVLPAPAPAPPGDAVIGESWKRGLLYLIGTASMAASAFHGYRRNESVGWALWWGFAGAVAPIITPVIAVAQGFGKPKRGGLTPNRRRRGKRRLRRNGTVPVHAYVRGGYLYKHPHGPKLRAATKAERETSERAWSAGSNTYGSFTAHVSGRTLNKALGKRRR